jgi:hypothetical protein
MRLLCHRGYWRYKSEQNTLAALERAGHSGYGVETDIRDCDGELIISHDMPTCMNSLSLEVFLNSYIATGKNGLLALNIKSDGLQHKLRDLLARFGVENYFVFDMSVPDTLGYIRTGIPFAARLSEYEDGHWLRGHSNTVWLDAFEDEWYSRDFINSLLESGKRVCVVSPELHKRPHKKLWDELRLIPAPLAQDLYLCTDLFSEAEEVFNVIRN